MRKEVINVADGQNIEGTWVHVFNSLGATWNTSWLLNQVSWLQGQSKGEICVSSEGKGTWYHRGRPEEFLAVCLKGVASHYFDSDVYSFTGEDGKRYATRRNGFKEAKWDEAWLCPADCQVSHFYAGPECPQEWVDALEARGWEVRRVFLPKPDGLKERKLRYVPKYLLEEEEIYGW